jgi:hypothetical protein
MALCREVVDLIRLVSLYDSHQAAGVRHVSIVQKEATVCLVWILIEMIDPVRVE